MSAHYDRPVPRTDPPWWRLPATWVGFVGSALVGLGATSNGFSFNKDGWGVGPIAWIAQQIDRQGGNLLIAAGCVLAAVAWFLVIPRPGRTPPVQLWLVWSAPLVLLPPVMSGDPFLYADLGWIMSQGGNPYRDVLGSMGGPFVSFVDPFWAGNGVAYPPLSLLVNWGMAELAGMHPYWGVIIQRLPALAGMALIAYFLPKLADRLGADRQWAIWLGVLNPIAIVHLVGGAHNDALMAGVVVFAIWLSLQPIPKISASLVLAPIVIGLAMALKQQAGLAVVAAAGLPVVAQMANLPHLQKVIVLGWRTAVAAVVALGTFAAVSLATGLGFGWTLWLGQMGRARTLTLSVAIGDLLAWTGTDLTGLANVVLATVALAGIAALLLLRPDQPLAITAWGSILVLFIGQAMHPWYVGLGLALIALLPLKPSATRAVVFIGLGYFMAYTVQNLWNQHVLPAGFVGVVFGLVGYATFLGLRNRATRLG